jgi:hypothetical protein
VSITGFPVPLRSLVYNPRVIMMKGGGDLLSPMYGMLRAPPLGCNASASGECSSVFYVRSSDQGHSWSYASRIDVAPSWLPWADSEGACEPSLVQLPDERLLTVFRVDSRSMLFQAFSSDSAQTWSAPRRLPAWSVMPQLQMLSNGVLVLTSGRPGLGMWVRPTAGGPTDDDRWLAYDLAAEHSKQVAPLWQYTGNTINASCVGSIATACHNRMTSCTTCTPTGGGTNATTTPQSTAYTGMVEVAPTVAELDSNGGPAAAAEASGLRTMTSVVLIVYLLQL